MDEISVLRAEIERLTLEKAFVEGTRDACEDVIERQNEDLAAARVELSQLRAKIEKVRATVEAWPDGWERTSDYAAARGQCKRAVLAVLAEPLGSPEQPAGDEGRIEGPPVCERCDDVGCYSCQLGRFI